MSMLEISDLQVVYANGTQALKSISLRIEAREVVAIIGRSGAGKSTLLRCINGLQKVTSGKVMLDGQDVTRMNERQLRDLRRSIGFIWQEYNLIERLPVMTNVQTGRLGYNNSMASWLGLFSREDRAMAVRNLERVNLLMRANNRADAFEVGPFSYLIAAQEAHAEALVVSNFSPDMNTNVLPGYYSVLFTRKGSGIKSIDDLKGKTFAFTDPASTSGYEIPATDIMNAEKLTSKDQLDSFFGQDIFAGSHPASVVAVATGKVDAGATFDDNLVEQNKAGYTVCGIKPDDVDGTEVFDHPMTQDQVDAIYNACPDGNIAVFHQSSVIPQTPFAINSQLPQSFKDAVKAALLDLVNQPDVVKQLGRYYIDVTKVDTSLTSVDAYYDGLRDVATKLDIDLTLPS